MSLKSMTGYGRGEASTGGIKVEVELSTVNRKQYDVRVSLPKTLAAMESRIYELIHRSIARGYVTGMVKIGVSGATRQKCVSIDMDMAKAQVRKLRAAAAALGLKDDLTARSIICLPEVVRYKNVPGDLEKIWSLVRRALLKAIGQLVKMRQAEGLELEKDITCRFDKLKLHLDKIRKLAPKIPQKYRKMLSERIKKAGVSFRSGDQQLLKEIALFADRSDISEEIVRSDSHFKQVPQLVTSGGSVGRALDFLCQEMFREINTIGSKANDAAVSRYVIQFKAQLESIREQIQNVE